MIRLTLAAALLAFPVFADELQADDCAATGCTCSAGQCPLHKPGRPRAPTFDATTVGSFEGVVLAVEREAGVTLTVRRGEATVRVHLGPVGYVDERAQFAAGDVVEVTGSHVMVEGQATVLTTRVKRGERVLKLRDATTGAPLFR